MKLPRLIKYCKPQHSLLNGCPTVRLGTLDYYRELDPTFQLIADPAEGLETVNVDSLKMETATTDAKACVKAVLPDMPHIHVQDISLNVMFPNSYIFCCSVLNKCKREEHAARFDREYTEHYEITDVVEFVQRLARMLQSTISIHHFSDPVREKLRQLPIQDWGLTVGWHMQPVRYVPEKTIQISEGIMKHYVEEIPQPIRSVFVKPQKYDLDQEFRILFLVQHPKLGVLSVAKEPVNLPVMPVSVVPPELNVTAQPHSKKRSQPKKPKKRVKKPKNS